MSNRDAPEATRVAVTHSSEPHGGSVAGRLNWLRAGVLGANDGIISTAGLVIGVAAATTSTSAIATAGVAGLTAGAVSMALGEYVSVSTQRDTEYALVEKERSELQQMPEAERVELVQMLGERGLTEATSNVVADELSEQDTLRTHLTIELGIDQDEIAKPWAAALSSAIAFIAGAALPLVAILLPPASARIAVSFFMNPVLVPSPCRRSMRNEGQRRQTETESITIKKTLQQNVWQLR